MANANMQIISIRQQIASAVHVLVQASRMSDGSRQSSISRVTGMEVDMVTLQDIYVFEKRGLSPMAACSDALRQPVSAEVLRKTSFRGYTASSRSVR